MTPSLPTLLLGQAVALTAPAPPESSGDYAAGRIGLVATLLVLAAQEAEKGPAARVWENRAIAELLASARASDPRPARGDSAASWRDLDAANAELRRRLIALHEAAEIAGDHDLQARILALYVEMAKARRLDLPGAGG
jgi:hypothetical protein